MVCPLQEKHSCGYNNGATLWTGLIQLALPDGRKYARHDVSNALSCRSNSVTFVWFWKLQGLSIENVSYRMEYWFD